jgi:plasmid stabilization system protein ParE
MVKKVKISKKANRRISEMAKYLEDKFSYQAADKLVDSFYETITKITEHPSRGRKSPTSETLYFMNMDSHRHVFYRTYGTTLSIVDVFDTRQNPDKRPK